MKIGNKEFEYHEKSGLFVARDGEIYFPPKPKSVKYPNGKRTYGSNTNGYLRVMYHGKIYLVHRLVAETYIPNPDNLPFINHKDETPSNNNVGNLEWCDHTYNMNYGTAQQRKAEKLSKPVAQYDLSGNLIAIFQSAHEVERTLGYSNGHISKCCLGKLKTAYKYLWRYA